MIEEKHDYEVTDGDIEVLLALSPKLKWFTTDINRKAYAWFHKPVRKDEHYPYSPTEEHEFDRKTFYCFKKDNYPYFLERFFYEEEPVSREWLIENYKKNKRKDTELLEMLEEK